MKKLIATLLLFYVGYCQAQYSKGLFSKEPIYNQENFDKQRVHYGYFLGFNSYDFKFSYINPAPTPGTIGDNSDILVDRTTGFNVGLVGDLRLQDYINLRFEPGLYYTQRILNYRSLVGIDSYREVSSTYLHFPLLLKFSSLRTGNIRPYLVGGVSATLNLGSNSKSKDDNNQQVFRVKPWTQNYEIGFGIDLYLEYFKFSPSIRGVFGLGDELIRDNIDPSNPNPWNGNQNISSMKTRAILVNFTFH
jgi:hypothetical protein